METISQYKVVRVQVGENNDEVLHKFEIEVNEKLNDGWRLHGTPFNLSTKANLRPQSNRTLSELNAIALNNKQDVCLLCQVMVK